VKAIGRRQLLKGFLTSIAFSSLFPLLKGCITTRDTKEELKNVVWDTNPAVPIPIDGCYVGSHSDILQTYIPYGRNYIIELLKKYDSLFINNLISYHKDKGGYIPAVFSFSTMHIGADWFPKNICEAIQNMGVIPLIRFHYPDDHLSLVKGKFDGELKNFARSIVEFQQPIFFVPWPVINYRRIPKGYFYRSGKVDIEAIQGAWERMHRIFENEGANEQTVWGLHLLLDNRGKSIEKFKLDPSLFDWIGFSVYKIWNWVQSYAISYEIKIASEWARIHYPNKPAALFELGVWNNDNQGRNIISAYNIIKRLPRIKMVMYYQFEFAGFGCCNTLIGMKSKAAYKEAIADPYYIKGGMHLR